MAASSWLLLREVACNEGHVGCRAGEDGPAAKGEIDWRAGSFRVDAGVESVAEFRWCPGRSDAVLHVRPLRLNARVKVLP